MRRVGILDSNPLDSVWTERPPLAPVAVQERGGVVAFAKRKK
jgi:hypothetical protein